MTTDKRRRSDDDDDSELQVKKTKREEDEERKRKETRETFERQAHAYYMWKTQQLSDWHPVNRTDEKGKTAPLPNAGGGMRVSNIYTTLGLKEPGVYRSTKYPGMDLLLSKNGSVTSLEKVTKKNFDQFVNATIDFLAMGKGAKSITIDWKSDKVINEKKLLKVMKMAADKGMAVEFGPNVQKYLNSNRSDKISWFKEAFNPNEPRSKHYKELSPEEAQARRTRIYDKQLEMKKAAKEATKEPEYAKYTEEFRYGKYEDKFNSTTKLPASATAEDDLKNRVFKKLTDDQVDKKLDAVGKEIQDIVKRSGEVQTAKSELEGEVSEQLADLDDDDVTQKRVDEIEANQVAREKFSDAMHSEYADLYKRSAIWRDTLEDMKQDLEDQIADQMNPPSPAEEEKMEKQIERIDKQIDKINKTMNNLNEGTSMSDLHNKVKDDLPNNIDWAKDAIRHRVNP